jgi:WD repeat and SOF domain-containing protein 1
MFIASCASDRSIILYDTREVKPMRKIVMKLKTNQVAWNPMEAYVFTAANEDYK